MLDTSEFYTYINDLLSDFSAEHNHLWQVGFNGRSSGYLVLYQGFSRLSGYKSFCRECGQRNYKTVEETSNNRCGRCGADARVNFETMPKEVGCYPGRSTDSGRDTLQSSAYRRNVFRIIWYDYMVTGRLNRPRNKTTSLHSLSPQARCSVF